MKRLIIASVFLLFVSFVFAQGDFFDLGLKGGINVSKLSVDADDYNDKSVNKVNFGAYARLNLGRIYIQPEAYYSNKGGKIDKIGWDTPSEFDLKALDIPVLLGVKIINKEALNFRVMAGPMFSYLADKEVSGNDYFSEGNIKDSFMGWQYGAGIDFLMFTFDVRVESGSDVIKNVSDIPDSKNKAFVLSLGIRLM
jgi:hypothetical protein